MLSHRGEDLAHWHIPIPPGTQFQDQEIVNFRNLQNKVSLSPGNAVSLLNATDTITPPIYDAARALGPMVMAMLFREVFGSVAANPPDLRTRSPTSTPARHCAACSRRQSGTPMDG
jgi:hypothetical protein